MGRPQSWVASSSLGWHSKAAEVGAGGGRAGGTLGLDMLHMQAHCTPPPVGPTCDVIPTPISLLWLFRD